MPRSFFTRSRSVQRMMPGLTASCFLVVCAVGQPVPLHRAHAHNDYDHDRPLYDALERGFTSIEVDIHLRDGALLVGHDSRDLKAGRTIQSLYLEPIARRAEAGGGRLFADDTPLQLLVDIKTDADATYDVLRRVLVEYAALLTRYDRGNVVPGSVTIVLSGNRPRETLDRESLRFAFYDGRLDDLDADPPSPASFMPLVSANWHDVYAAGGATPDEHALQELHAIVLKAHAQRKNVRFWATPEDPALWRLLYEADVDYINTDDLEGLRRFLSER